MDRSFRFNGKITKWRGNDNSSLHFSVVHDYCLNLSRICDVGELPYGELFNDIVQNALHGSSPRIPASFAKDFQGVFMVPTLNKFHENIKRINKYQLVEAFLSFLLQLLFHKTDWMVELCKDRINNLEKELRFLLTILGHISLILCDDEHEQVQNLLEEFEIVANEAGRLVHSLLFPVDQASEKMDEGFAVVLNNMDLLNANIMKFLNHVSSINTSAYKTPKTSVVDSLLFVDSLIYDLEDLMKREYNRIADVKDQIKLLHQGLVFLNSSTKDIGSPQPAELGELKEPLMRMGDVACEVEYLISSFLVGDAPLWYLISRLTHVNHEIELIGTELEEFSKKYEFGGLKVAKYFNSKLSLQAQRNLEIDDLTIGLEDKEMHILEQLVGGKERLQVISIFGMPGLGKTTLAKKLYDHPSTNYWFDKLSWCVLSQIYQRRSILAIILTHLRSEFDDRILKMEEESLVEHIYKTLKGRRYLIVLDNVWGSNVWDNFRMCFPDDGNGSRILFTSRNKEVAPKNSIIYALPSLSSDQCWELLEKKVFDSRPCPPELLGVGKKIAADCCGLPLVVVVIAGILSTMDKEKSTWEEVGGNLASYMFYGGDNSVMQILELSYKHLPENLKPCFLYFGAFRENKEIPVGRLMRLWIAEGFIRKQEDKNAEDVAEEYLMQLIDKSLVMVAKRGSRGRVKTCVLHDLLYDLCSKRSEEEKFLKFGKNNNYSIFEKGHRLHSVSGSYCQHVRSFHVGNVTSSFYVRDMRLLRVLHSDYRYSFFIGIEYLLYLRYLVISDLPASIDSLVNLEYLSVEAFGLVFLPPAIAQMKKLRYIHVGSEALYDKDCNNSQTNKLEFLSGVTIMKPQDEEMLKCSPHLRKLKCKCMQMKGYFDLCFLTQLESLDVTFYRFGVEVISLPSSIRKLTLSFLHMPWEKMSIFGRLKYLEVLKLSISNGEESWDTRDGEFQQLRFLKMETEHLTQWNVASSQPFPKLQQLVLSNCSNLQEIPSEIGEIPTLQLIEVKGRCTELVVESAKLIQQQQWDNTGIEELRVIISRWDKIENPEVLQRQHLGMMQSCITSTGGPSQRQWW